MSKKVESLQVDLDRTRSALNDIEWDIDNLERAISDLKDNHQQFIDVNQELQNILDRNRDAFMYDMVGRKDAIDVVADLLDELASMRRNGVVR